MAMTGYNMSVVFFCKFRVRSCFSNNFTGSQPTVNLYQLNCVRYFTVWSPYCCTVTTIIPRSKNKIRNISNLYFLASRQRLLNINSSTFDYQRFQLSE